MPAMPNIEIPRFNMPYQSPMLGIEGESLESQEQLAEFFGVKDGVLVKSCLMPVAAVEGAEITTVEGLGTAPDGLAPLQEAFHSGYAAQCGFCTPGMLMAAHALIQRAGGPVDREQVIDALSGHICRCTGYVKIVDAVIAASGGETVVAQAPREPEGAVA